MKTTIKGYLFWTIAIVLILGMCMVAEILSQIITIKAVMIVVYIILAFSFIYLLKN